MHKSSGPLPYVKGQVQIFESFEVLVWFLCLKKYEKYNVYLKIITQLEDLFKNKQLDIEMVLDKNNSPQLLQVRPLMGKKLNKESIFDEKDVIDRNLKNYKRHFWLKC